MTYEEIYTQESLDCLAQADVVVPEKKEFTCNRCADSGTCEFAWDLYNTNGDCLAMK